MSWCGAPRSRSSGGRPSEKAVHGLGLDGRLEAPVQLVVERPRAVHRRDVLRDAGEVERPLARVPEGGCELGRRGRPRRRARAPARRAPPRAPSRSRLRRPCSAPFRPGAEAGLVTEDRRLELPAARLPGSMPSSSSASRASEYACSASACRPARYSASMSSSQERSRSGCSRTSASSSPIDVAGRPSSRSAVDPLLDRDEPELVEPADLGLREVVERELGERRPAPQLERTDEQRCAARPARRSARPRAAARSGARRSGSADTRARSRAGASRAHPGRAPSAARRRSSGATPSPSSAARRRRARRRADPSGRPGPRAGGARPGARAAAARRARSARPRSRPRAGRESEIPAFMAVVPPPADGVLLTRRAGSEAVIGP